MALRFDPNEHLSVEDDLQIVRVSPGVAIAHGSGDSAPYDVIEGNIVLLERLIDAVRTHRRVGAILDCFNAVDDAESLLEAVVLQGWVTRYVFVQPFEAQPRVVIVGDGALAGGIVARLSELAFSSPERIEIDAPASKVEGAAVVVLALEGMAYESVETILKRLNALARPCVFVTYERGRVFLGPTSVPGRFFSFLDARRSLLAKSARATPPGTNVALARLSLHRFPKASSLKGAAIRGLLERATQETAIEVERVLDPSRDPQWLRAIQVIRSRAARISTRRFEVDTLVNEETVDEETSQPEVLGHRDLGLSVDVELARQTAYPTERPETPLPTSIRSVGIVGGGTAGYLTALALRKKRPELEVTLIESSKIPVIGVGEATTALLNYFLHGTLGLDILDFYSRVRPTWKLGIRFEWGLPGDYFFNSPFQFGRLLESLVYEKDINQNCLASRMMSANTTPIILGRDGRHRSLLGEVSYAYHLDNRRFVAYLSEEAKRAGVRHIDCVVEAGIPNEHRTAIDHLVTDSSEKLAFDLYIDATGFRSLLMGKALGSPYQSFASSLFNDTAVVADVPHNGVVKPYTTAETMNHGWCWNIPMETEDHRGYVFSSAFASVEEAALEMRAKNPGMGDTRTIRFQSGRHDHFWKGNTVAIGNSYGFVEPLQSTAIHMVLVEIDKLVRSFPREPSLSSFQAPVNGDIGEVWDTLRWFLAAHYRFNRKLDTPYWKECRKSADIAGIADIVDLFSERAPIAGTPHHMKELDHSTFGVYRYDLLFMGMGMPTTYVSPQIDESSWRRASRAAARVADRALLHGPALEVLRSSPDLLLQHARELALGR